MGISAVLLQVFARGGGGGSGGGVGGGGGGAGGGGSGSGIIVLLGYVPMHFVGAIIRRVQKKNRAIFDILQIFGWVVAALYAVLLVAALKGIGFLAALGVIPGMGAGLYNWFGKLKTNKKAEVELKQAASTDPAWDEATLISETAAIFQRFQADWSKNDANAMQPYLTPGYFYHVSLMIMALNQASRVDQMSEVQILSQDVQQVLDTVDNNQDRVTIGFNAQATDQLIDTRSQQVLFTDKSAFVEYWNFLRSGNNWLLAGIDQATANYSSANSAIQEFAVQQQFCYSLDWGWLLLPQRGQIFGHAGKFGVSDINNHVIGMYNNVLIQIYTYNPNPQGTTHDQYLIAQVQLPKSYGDILVRRKGGFASGWFGVKGLDRIEMEWPDFNKKYEVFTSTAEGPTSFELLHPVFMETLEAAPFEVNLEVVDNFVYFYTKETGLHPEHYPAMLAILQEAFKQMKM